MTGEPAVPGPGLIRRTVVVPRGERAWLRSILEAYDGLAVWCSGDVPLEIAPGEQGERARAGGDPGLFVLLAPSSRREELDGLLRDLRAENPRLS